MEDAKRKALADDPRVAALMDCQFMAGVTAGWNAAHDPEPDEKLAAISKAYEGRVKPLLKARAAPQPAASDVPHDVVRLVIAARNVAYTDPDPEALRELDQAAEAFASRVRWDDEPENATSGASIALVKAATNPEDIAALQRHIEWLKERLADGWPKDLHVLREQQIAAFERIAGFLATPAPSTSTEEALRAAKRAVQALGELLSDKPHSCDRDLSDVYFEWVQQVDQAHADIRDALSR